MQIIALYLDTIGAEVCGAVQDTSSCAVAGLFHVSLSRNQSVVTEISGLTSSRSGVSRARILLL
jgi:hypothetical protein